jgi:hypothetical protein
VAEANSARHIFGATHLHGNAIENMGQHGTLLAIVIKSIFTLLDIILWIYYSNI